MTQDQLELYGTPDHITEQKMRFFTCSILLIIALQTAVFAMGQAATAAVTKAVEQPVVESIAIRRDLQQEEEEWRAERQVMLARYEYLQQQLEQVRANRQHLEEQHAATRKRIDGKLRELQEIERIQTDIDPLIEDLAEDLTQLVDRDLPFLQEERRLRLDRLAQLNSDPETDVSERFRKTMETLLIEAEYGSTIETYQQTIAVDGREILVNFFRLGRIALFYQHLNGMTSGIYNVAASAWEPLPQRHNRAIQAALEVAGKQRPVEIMTLPLGRLHPQ
jgi:hypothetical protein